MYEKSCHVSAILSAILSKGRVESRWNRLRPLATEATGELEVLGLNGNTLGMDRSQVGVLEQGDEVGLGSLLERTDGGGLEAHCESAESAAYRNDN